MKKIIVIAVLILLAIKTNAQEVPYIGVGAKTTTDGGDPNTLDWNHVLNTKSGTGEKLLRGNAANGPALGSGAYFHPFNFEYIKRDGTGNTTQIAMPYGHSISLDLGLRMRGRYNGSWSPWVRIISENAQGDVGIGTSSPQGKLQVDDGNFNTILTGNNVLFSRNNGPAYIWSKNAGGYMSFGTNGRQTSNANSNLILKPDQNSYFNGNVGIGTSSPTAGLEVKNDDGIKIHSITNGGYRGTIKMADGLTNATTRDDLLFSTYGGFVFKMDENNNGVSTIGGFNIFNGTDESVFLINESNGNVGIGTTNPETWKLAVNGKIRAKEIKVETGWSDFVFYKDYKLPTLQEVENYIKEKGHLKDIPSAKEVEENGVFLGEMDSKLLQKIEELTLYAIQQEKKLEKQANELRDSKKLNKELESRLSKLETLVEKLNKN